jgi:hypothetical protein
MNARVLCPALLLLALGCNQKPSEGAAQRAPADPASAPATPQLRAPETLPTTAAEPAAPASSSATRQFGAPAKLEGAPLPVAQILAAPDPYLNQTVKCEGKVARVCQAAGCWLELQSPSGGDGLRVPMANHAFFIPQDAIGQLATIEGQLKRHDLPEAQKQHYQGEGMKATGPLSLEATSVALH